MNCDEYRKQQILTEEEENLPAELRQHFAQCEECQRYLREQERLRSEVRKLAKSEHAPQGLRESVTGLLRQPGVRKQQGARRWAAVAAAIVLLAGAGASFVWYYHTRTASPERLAQEFITDHLHYLP